MTPDDITRLAYDIGAKGAEPTEDDRRTFEEWMRGHCWEVEGEWTGQTYQHPKEDKNYFHPGAMNTRRLFAAWRDRGALDSSIAQQQGKAGGVALVDTTIAAHIAAEMHGPKYGVDWAYHCDVRGLLSEREAFAPPAHSHDAGVTDERVERLAKYIAQQESHKCASLDAALHHQATWKRIVPEARAMLTAALAPQPKDAT